MTIEVLYFNSFRHGKQPKIQRLSVADLADETIPLRLYLGQMMGCTGFRQVNHIGEGIQWYWPRSNGDWWLIPKGINDAVNKQYGIEGKTNFMMRNRVGSSNIQLWKSTKEYLRNAGGIVSIDDGRVSRLINPGKDTEDPLSKKLRDRVAALLARRNGSSCDIEKEILDWMLIELVQPIC